MAAPLSTKFDNGMKDSDISLQLPDNIDGIKINNINAQSASEPFTLLAKLPQHTCVGASTLKEICTYLETQAEKEPEKTKEKILILTAKIQNSLRFTHQAMSYRHGIEDYNFQTAKYLHSYFKKLSHLFKNNQELSELSYLTAKMLKTTWLEKLKQHNFEDVFDEFAPFGEPSTGKSRTFKFSLSGGASAIPVEGVTGTPNASAMANAGYSHIKEYNADDEGLFFENKYHKGTVGISGGLEWDLREDLNASFNASLSSNSAYVSFKEFGNVKMFAENDGLSLKDPYAGIWQNFKRRFSQESDLKRLLKAEQFSASAARRYSELLTNAQIQPKNFTASFPNPDIPLPGYMHTVAGVGAFSGGINTSLLANDYFNINAAAGGSISYANEFIDIHEFLPESLYNIVTENPDMIDQIPPYLLRKIQSEQLDNQQAILETTHALLHDIQQYYATVREYDYAVKSSFTDKSQRKRLKKIKQQIEDNWGAVGRHQLLQIWLASHAYISCEAKKINSSNETITALLVEVQSILLEPQIAYNKRLIRDIANFQYDLKLTIAEHRGSVDINATIFSGNVTVTKRHRVHPSTLRDGDYYDVSITGTMGLDASGVFNIAAISELIKNRITEEGIEGFPEDFALSPDAGMDGSLNCLIRFFKPRKYKTFSENKGWRKQVTRYRSIINADTSVNLSGSALPFLSIGTNVGASLNKTKLIKEVIEPDDITYPMIRFNRYYRNNNMSAHNQDWLNFTQLHKKEFKKLFKKLAKDSIAREELNLNFDVAEEFALFELKSAATQEKIRLTRAHLIKALEVFKADDSEANYQTVLFLLSDAFGYMVPHWWAEHMSRWGEPEFLAGKYSGLKFGSKLKVELGLTKRGKKVRFEKEEVTKI